MHLPETENLFKDHYILVDLVVNEDPRKDLEIAGAYNFLTQWGGENKGLPYWVILNTHGEPIANSLNGKSNMGCPASWQEVNSFKKKLADTSNISVLELDIIERVFHVETRSAF